MTTLYGISNCDTVKKARKWLESHQIDYRFCDFRKDGIALEQVQRWLDDLGREQLINRRSSTWKNLDDDSREQLSGQTAARVIAQHPTLIKRPLLDHNGILNVGFKPTEYDNIFN